MSNTKEITSISLISLKEKVAEEVKYRTSSSYIGEISRRTNKTLEYSRDMQDYFVEGVEEGLAIAESMSKDGSIPDADSLYYGTEAEGRKYDLEVGVMHLERVRNIAEHRRRGVISVGNSAKGLSLEVNGHSFGW